MIWRQFKEFSLSRIAISRFVKEELAQLAALTPEGIILAKQRRGARL